ncbi:uncharacterized protein LOC114273018 [Camellia sinensis]|uniref:uncharacterized protein LOC114273018 n=1 Tax=Camellia sinensis TaxID=4442 RepID=UPI001035BEE1|nr:uncharacterized protein LOC114273018 [Camellia sinensis]
MWVRGLRYQINYFNGQQFVVDLGDSTCSCRKWDLTGIPCCHAISAIYDKHEQPEDYVAHWYKKETYLASYKPMIYPINGSEMWPKSVLPGLLPPKVKEQPGRPRKLRKMQANEPKNPYKMHRGNTTTTCSLCSKLGQNKRGCKGQPIAPKVTNNRSSTQRSSQAHSSQPRDQATTEASSQ